MAINPDKLPNQAHWRDSAKRTRFFFVDAYAVFPLILFLVHIRWWTFYLAVAFIGFFTILERFQFTLPVFFRWLRSTLAGPYRIAKPWFRE